MRMLLFCMVVGCASGGKIVLEDAQDLGTPEENTTDENTTPTDEENASDNEDDNSDNEDTGADIENPNSDEDGDGYPNEQDCDDTNPNVNPGATEICDQLDNDCNGSVDDNASDALTWFEDLDQDGYGNASVTTTNCAQPNGYVTDDNDCNDNATSINPNANEICDGVDNNCDGTGDTDAVCPCNVQSYGGKTYLFCDQSTNWFSANSACQSQTNYHLAVINDEDENNWVTNTANGMIYHVWWWIGYDNTGASSSEEPAGAWTWVNGLSSSYTNWDDGQPDDYYNNEDCTHIYGQSGTWNDMACDLDNWYGSSLYYVCESTVP